MRNRYAFFRGYIVTANHDGSIPINSLVVCKCADYTEGAEPNQTFVDMLAEANYGADMLDHPRDPTAIAKAEGKS